MTQPLRQLYGMPMKGAKAALSPKNAFGLILQGLCILSRPARTRQNMVQGFSASSLGEGSEVWHFTDEQHELCLYDSSNPFMSLHNQFYKDGTVARAAASCPPAGSMPACGVSTHFLWTHKTLITLLLTAGRTTDWLGSATELHTCRRNINWRIEQTSICTTKPSTAAANEDADGDMCG